MLPPPPVSQSQLPLLTLRLTALWAACEVGLGGLLHGIRLPITGITVGGIAVVLVCLLGYYSQKRSEIVKATIIVCIIKGMLAPHTPLPAYLAVLFQGITGAWLVSGRRVFAFRCILFAILALLESALQKLLVLTLLFGVGFWDALNEFTSKLARQFGSGPGQYGNYVVAGYVGLHIIGGVMFGVFAFKLPRIIANAKAEYSSFTLPQMEAVTTLDGVKRKSIKWVKPVLLFVWAFLAVLLIQALAGPGEAWLPAGDLLYLIIRSAALLLTWYLFVGPLLLKLFRKWLAQKQGTFKDDVQAVLSLMPATLSLLRQCWQASGSQNGLGRLRAFLLYLTVNIFPAEPLYDRSK